MVKPTIVEEAPISMVQMREELDAIKKKEKDLNFRSNKTYEYLNQSVTLSRKKYDELFKKIDALKISRLRDQHIIKIIDLMPGSIDELKAVLQSYTITVTNDNMKKIVELVEEYKE
jgi:DNA-directed RNA polymerase subunit F